MCELNTGYLMEVWVSPKSGRSSVAGIFKPELFLMASYPPMNSPELRANCPPASSGPFTRSPTDGYALRITLLQHCRLAITPLSPSISVRNIRAKTKADRRVLVSYALLLHCPCLPIRRGLVVAAQIILSIRTPPLPRFNPSEDAAISWCR